MDFKRSSWNSFNAAVKCTFLYAFVYTMRSESPQQRGNFKVTWKGGEFSEHIYSYYYYKYVVRVRSPQCIIERIGDDFSLKIDWFWDTVGTYYEYIRAVQQSNEKPNNYVLNKNLIELLFLKLNFKYCARETSQVGINFIVSVFPIFVLFKKINGVLYWKKKRVRDGCGAASRRGERPKLKEKKK